MNRVKTKWPFMFLAAFFMIGLLSGEARGEKRIGILLFSEETRYKESASGVVEQLGKEGFKEPTVKFTVENAGGEQGEGGGTGT